MRFLGQGKWAFVRLLKNPVPCVFSKVFMLKGGGEWLRTKERYRWLPDGWQPDKKKQGLPAIKLYHRLSRVKEKQEQKAKSCFLISREGEKHINTACGFMKDIFNHSKSTTGMLAQKKKKMTGGNLLAENKFPGLFHSATRLYFEKEGPGSNLRSVTEQLYNQLLFCTSAYWSAWPTSPSLLVGRISPCVWRSFVKFQFLIWFVGQKIISC